MIPSPAENQPRRNEEDEERATNNLRALRFFVVDFHFFSRAAHCRMNDSYVFKELRN
jgi:hypothetical protein